MRYNKNQKAIAYTIVVICLFFISVGVVFFVRFSMMEGNATSNNTLNKQANKAAIGAIHWAASRIPTIAMSKSYSHIGKIDTPNPKSGSKFQYDTYQFRHSPHTPVEKLPEQFKNVSKQYPSFYNDQNMEFINQNLPFQYSHCTKLWDDWQNTKTEEPNYIGYSTLKCVDASAYLNINLPYRGNHNSASYERMLQNLLQIIQVKESGHLQGAFQISNIISKIFAKRQEFSNQFSNHQREKDGYNDLGELSHLVESGAISQINLDIFSRYLTVDSWGHKNYVPYALNIQEGIDSIYENIDYEKNELMHPINLNVASEEILTVVFEGITAVHKNRKGESFNTIISKLVAQTLAKNIVSDRQKKSDNLGNSSCFRNWNEVEAYLLNKLTKPQAHAIFSAIYPGMLQNKKTPDIAHHRTFDRLDIAKGNVECCLFSPGIFYFEAISRIVPRKGAPIIANRPYENLAQSKQTANIQLWEPHIVNTQHDFEHERQNKNSAETAWSGIISKTPSSTEWSPNISPENIGDGYLFERNPHNNTDCTLFSWASREVNNEICERRPDGVYMKSYKHPQIITNQKDIWNEEGFNFWIKPGYNLQANYDPNDSGQGDENKYVIEDEILIAAAKHTTPWPGSIITRCAYDWKTHDSTTNAPYLTLSRTFVYNNPPGNTERNEKNFRTFFNAPVNDNIKKLLRNKAPIAEHAVAWYVFKAHLRPKRCIGYEMDNVLQFHAEFIDKTYNTMTEGTPNFIKIDCTVLGYKLNGSTVTHSTTVTFHLEHPWTQMTIDNIRMPIKDGTDVLTIWPLIFDPKQVSDIKPVPEQCNPDHDDANEVSNPETNTKIGYYALYQSPVRNTQQREATDIKQFEDDPIHHEFLKYSRVERRIPIKLRRGHWYHIQGRWEKDRIYIKDFTVHEGEPFQNSLQQEAPPMKMTRGPLLKNLMSGPLRTWAFNGIEVYKNKGTQENTDLNIKNLNDLQNNKIYFYAPDCVLYNSTDIKGTQRKEDLQRYAAKGQDTIFQGQFDLENIQEIIGNNNPFYFGTVHWSQFYPKNKGNSATSLENYGAQFTINNHRFLTTGVAASSTSNLPNPIFKQRCDLNSNNTLNYTFTLFDKGNEDKASHFETIIIDRIVLYLLMEPKILNFQSSF